MNTTLQTELTTFVTSINGVNDLIPQTITDWLNWNLMCSSIGIVVGLFIMSIYFIVKYFINKSPTTFTFDASEKKLLAGFIGIMSFVCGSFVIVCSVIDVVKIAVYPNVYILDKLMSSCM